MTQYSSCSRRQTMSEKALQSGSRIFSEMYSMFRPEHSDILLRILLSFLRAKENWGAPSRDHDLGLFGSEQAYTVVYARASSFVSKYEEIFGGTLRDYDSRLFGLEQGYIVISSRVSISPRRKLLSGEFETSPMASS
jgi:hypothetical protein